MKTRNKLIIAVGVLLVFAAGVWAGRKYIAQWNAKRPVWQVSLQNVPGGLEVEIHQSNSSHAIYRVVLPEKKTPREIHRLTREQLPPETGRTLDFDETMRPGQWMIEVQGSKILIMERALILDDGPEIQPGRTTSIPGSALAGVEEKGS